ncbi:hypothetical protein SAMN06298212_10495 [Ruaniaceae bacterium KH17]|nr:hypothetical protein SAMN06298212_10495 [Ruaniaceae bacterium KH17]
MTATPPESPFTMLGEDAVVCEGDVCFVPGVSVRERDVEEGVDALVGGAQRL